MSQRPKLAVFDNGGNQAIHVTILSEAGLTPIDTANPLLGGSYITVAAGLFTGIDECFTFASEPHWAGTLADSLTTDNVRQFILSGGNFLAQCRGVDTYENFSLTNIVSTKGISIINQTVTHEYFNPDLAYMQFEGDVFENMGGSERNWIRSSGSQWRPGFYYAISDFNRKDTIITSGAHIISPDSVGGNVFYLGGHDYSAFTTVELMNSARMYMNATLIPSGRPTLFTLDPGDTLFGCVGSPIQLGGSPTGPIDATYLWSPGIYLDDSTSQNPIATPPDTITYSVLAWRGGCIVGPFPVTLNVTPPPIVNAGTDQNVCGNISFVNLTGTVLEASGGVWTTNGSGTFADDSALITTYSPSIADSGLGNIEIYLTSTGGCDSTADTITITFTSGPTATAGVNQTTCDTAGVVLNGTVTVATGGIWTTNGTGIFVPSADSLNTTYVPNPSDTSLSPLILTLTTTGAGGCLPESDSLIVSFAATIFVDAGPTQTLCSGVGQTSLAGTVVTASGGTWTSPTGGAFTPSDTLLNANYNFTLADIANGSVTLTLSSTGNGSCTPVQDSITINIIPSVNAGPDSIVCNTLDTFQLTGTVENLSGTQWSTTGTGVFVPDDSTLNAQYVITPADVLLGAIDFVLTTLDTGLCPGGADTMTLTISPPAIANAGLDQTICEDNSGYPLSGSITNAGGSIWTSSGAGVFVPSPDSLIAAYVPDSAGTDTIYLSTTGSCNNANDFLVLSITPSPTVDAGPDTSTCATNLNVAINGLVTTATGGIWSTPNGTGSFSPSNTSLSATYIGTAADTATGVITIVLTSTGNGDCNAYSDSMNITYTPNLISVDAGLDQTACNNTTGVLLNGSVFIATGGTWSTSGSGTFSPSADSLNTSYIPSVADTLAGTVTLTLTSTGNGGCIGTTDSLEVSFLASAIVNAGADTVICYTTDTVYLAGSIVNAGGAAWTTGGTGTFTPNDSSLNVGYIFSVADFLNETVTLYLTTYLSCSDVVDSITIDIIPGVLIFPSDTNVCNDADTIPFTGVVTGAAGGIWASSGTGIFFPDDTSMSTNYILSAADSAAGTVIITLTTTGVLMGCPAATDILNITISPPPIMVAGPDQFVCSNQDSIQVSGSAINAGGIWSSNGTGIFTPNPSSLTTTYVLSQADTALGTVVLTLTSTGSCLLISDSLLIDISPPPTADFTAPNACLDSTSAFFDNTPGNIVSWNWDFGDLNTSTNANPQNLYAAAGTYNVTLSVTAQNGCSDTVVKPVTVLPRPTIGFDWEDVCNKDTMFFTNTSDISPPSVIAGYAWDFGDAMTSTAADPYHIYQNNGAYIVTLTVTSDAGCSDTWNTLVIVSPNPVAQFNADPTLVNTEEQIDFTDLSLGSTDIPDTIDISTWAWNFYYPESVTGGSSTSPNPSILYGDTGTYTVQLVVTNEYGCTDSTSEDVQVGLNPIVASGFSPDGSGQDGNNILVVHGGPYKALQFVIYNEWGEVIFESKSQDIGWDGTYNGMAQPIGVYVYTVIATSLDGKVHNFWGDVTLLR
ncbi:MAG: PKD domain-containing protein [Flavobacteriales bacterium]|nr:PKD domain-containing protein [Flavobacteriales bacterium]